MSQENTEAEKMIEGLNDYITELDPFRPPISIIAIYSTHFSFKGKNMAYFIRINHELHKKLQKELDPYLKK